MAEYHLIIGNKNTSSWSLRIGLLLAYFKIPHSEQVIDLHKADSKAQLQAATPNGKVPVLVVDGHAIWDSLAITEFLAEAHSELAIWPKNRLARAMSRSYAGEMHAGFAALRDEMPMDMLARLPQPELNAALRQDILRIIALFERALGQDEISGPYLFGKFSAADAFFAPVASRFRTYGVGMPDVVEEYVDAILDLSAMKEWLAAAKLEIT